MSGFLLNARLGSTIPGEFIGILLFDAVVIFAGKTISCLPAITTVSANDTRHICGTFSCLENNVEPIPPASVRKWLVPNCISTFMLS